jgi:hypothetical protein
MIRGKSAILERNTYCCIHFPFVGLDKCGSRHLPAECGYPSALSMEAMDAPGTHYTRPLSKPTRIGEAERRVLLIAVLRQLSSWKKYYSNRN